MENNFLELCDIEYIKDNGYKNVVDIAIDEDESFILSNGIISHNSALSAVRKFRDSQKFGAFPLKGKFINVSELTNAKVIKNEEVLGLMGAVGLKLGEVPAGLRYGKLYIYTDADPDGNAIAGALIHFFAKYWPELFEQEKIYKVMTPLVVTKKGTAINYFYTQDEYDKWEHSIKDVKSWNVEYKKGLASLEDYEYEEILKNPKVIKITKDGEYQSTLSAWFAGESDERKEKILGEPLILETALF